MSQRLGCDAMLVLFPGVEDCAGQALGLLVLFEDATCLIELSMARTRLGRLNHRFPDLDKKITRRACNFLGARKIL